MPYSKGMTTILLVLGIGSDTGATEDTGCVDRISSILLRLARMLSYLLYSFSLRTVAVNGAHAL